MQASETKLQKIIEGTQQYIIPLFQRPYSWKKPQWESLWEDVISLYEADNPRPHFMGSIVTMPTAVAPGSVSKYILIDGQQRLTTIFIFLSALRNVANETDAKKLGSEINTKFLVNSFEDRSGYYKLQPTNTDQAIFYQIIDPENNDHQVDINDPKCQSDILECYRFFEKKISQKVSLLELEIVKVKNIICNNLSLVSVVLSHDDDPYLVFESLNAKGRPLTQADLIRNYFFMQIDEKKQQSIYTRYWQPMQELLGDDLTEFIRHYLTRSGVEVRQNDIYFQIKDKIKEDALAYLKKLSVFSEYYARLLDPKREPNKDIRKQLYRLNCLELSTIYPFILNCYDDWMKNIITQPEFISILQIVENFILRRFICNVQTRGLNKIFALLYSQVTKATDLDSGSFVERLKLKLQDQSYPKDSEFRARLVDVKLYGANKSKKCKLILESIEEFYGHKEKVDFEKLSIEHIMPQNLKEEWKKSLGEDWVITHELLKHTLGNLTLTGYNSELADASFMVKKNLLKDSKLELNKYFESKTSWTREDIEERAAVLADVSLQIWSYFGEESRASSVVSPRRTTGESPQIVYFSGKEYPVRSWRDVLEVTLNAIADAEPELFANIISELPRFVGYDRNIFRRSCQLRNGVFIEVNLSSQDIKKVCRRAIEIVEISSDEWRVETR